MTNGCRPYLIAACSYSDGVERWLTTLKIHLSSCVQPVIIMYRPYFRVPENFIVFRQSTVYPGHVLRFLPVFDVIERLGKEHWYFWTDCADVIFQSSIPDLSELPENKTIIPCPENVLHKNASIWKPFLNSGEFRMLAEQMVFNAGCFAMKGNYFQDFLRYFFKSISTFSYSMIDQLIFNKWLYLRSENCLLDHTIFLSLYATYTGSDWPSKFIENNMIHRVNGRFETLDGHVFSIVHANGSTKSLLE